MAVVAGTHCVVVWYVGREHVGVELVVYLGEKVVLAAVERDVQLGFLKLRYEGCHSVAVPQRGIFLERFAEQFGHAPAFGEGAYVDAAAHAARIAEHLGVACGEVERSVAAHAEACHGAHGAFGHRGEIGVNIRHEVFYYERLHLHLGVGGRVPVPAVAPVGHHEHHAEAVGELAEAWLCAAPCAVVATVAVEKVYRGVFLALGAVGGYHCHFHGAFEACGGHRHGVDRESLGACAAYDGERDD